MKQSVNQLLNFFKNHKYGKASLLLLIIGLAAVGTMVIRSMMQEKPVALSNVAAAISAGRVEGIEELQGSNTLVIHYKDGTEDTTRRDSSTSFLEQMQFLGVSRNQMAKLEYEIVESKLAANDKVISTIVSIAMLGMMGFAVTRMGGGNHWPQKIRGRGDPEPQFQGCCRYGREPRGTGRYRCLPEK